MSLKMNVREKLDDDTLDLSMCDLQEIPVREIAAIRKASHLDLSNNRLESLPKTFVTLTQIVKLDLSKNMLSEIPENFGEMRQLRHLDLYGNRISRLPLSLGDLKNLKWLDLKENPLTPAVASVAGSCSNASECQACARNIVSYLANVKRTVEEEKQRRINAVTTVESEEESAPPKKESKKKKKKAAESKLRTRGDKPISNSESQNNHQNAKKEIPERSHKSEGRSSPRKGGVAGKLCGALTSLVIWLTLVALIIVLGIAILPLFNKNYSDTLTEYIELKTGVNVKAHQQLCTKIIETGIEKAALWAARAQAFVKDTYDLYGEGVSTSAKKEL